MAMNRSDDVFEYVYSMRSCWSESPGERDENDEQKDYGYERNYFLKSDSTQKEFRGAI
jgi:hypothetical protein